MSCVSFICYRTYFYFIVFWIIDIIKTIIIYKIKNDSINQQRGNEQRGNEQRGNEQTGNEQTGNEQNVNMQKGLDMALMSLYIASLCISISDLLGGFLVIITKLLSKSKKEEKKEIETKNDSSNKLIYNDQNEVYINNNNIFLILLISIVDLFGYSKDFFFILICRNMSQDSFITLQIPIEVICRIIFSKIVLNLRIYKHHIVSFIIIIIGFILLSFIRIDILKEINNIWIDILFIALKSIAYSIGDTLSKKILTKELILP